MDNGYGVYDSDTAELLDGSPSRELIEASIEAAPEGHVLAAWDGGEWIHVPDYEQNHPMWAGYDIRGVYAQE